MNHDGGASGKRLSGAIASQVSRNVIPARIECALTIKVSKPQTYLPARRAAAVDPIVALRGE